MADILGPSAPAVRSQTTFALSLWATDDTGKVIQLGTCKEFTPNQDKRNTLVGGVGIGDRILEIVPGRSKYTLRITKFALWEKSVAKAFGYKMPGGNGDGIRMIANMQLPIDIIQIHLKPNATDQAVEQAVTTVYKKCVLSRWNRPQRWDDDVTIVDEVEFDVTSIDDGTNSLYDLSQVF